MEKKSFIWKFETLPAVKNFGYKKRHKFFWEFQNSKQSRSKESFESERGREREGEGREKKSKEFRIKKRLLNYIIVL